MYRVGTVAQFIKTAKVIIIMKPIIHPFSLFALCLSLPASAQILPPTIGIPGTPSLNSIQRDIERNVPRDLARPQVINDVVDTSNDATATLLNTLPATLPIIGRDGKTALTEMTDGSGYRAVAREWIVEVNPQQLDRLRTQGITILSQNHYAALGIHTVRIRVDEQTDHLSALKTLLSDAPDEAINRNYIYAPERKVDPITVDTTEHSDTAAICQQPVKIGIIDTAIRTDHPALQQAAIQQRTFLNPDLAPASAHGTAIVGLLVGHSNAIAPLVPNASLYSASVFYARDGFSQGATLDSLLDAMQWLAEQPLTVINMSLAGPPSPLLHRAIQAMTQRGISVVAAVGNDGPASPPLYPAAYPETVAVTAVDHHNAIYRWAIQGKHVDFAALGVGVITARGLNEEGPESGTSIAAPLVTAKIACLDTQIDISQRKSALAKHAFDLGEPGRDTVFGEGLLHR